MMNKTKLTALIDDVGDLDDNGFEYVMCYHKNLKIPSNMRKNREIKCPNCKWFVTVCYNCEGILDQSFYDHDGQGGEMNLCQNMDIDPDGCSNIDMDNYHVDSKTAEWVRN